jgi:hypothetical protein
VLIALALLPACARADGDPASDVLASQPLFLPQDAGVSARDSAQLNALLTAASHAGYPIKVAVVASRADLGSVTALWNQPQSYARFLAQELSLVYRGPLLVVMPAGYGFAHVSPRAALGRPDLRLGPAAIHAVRRMAAATGRALPLATGHPSTAPHSTDAIAWIVFAAGAVIIVVAWGASLRARPLRAG